LAEKFTGVHDRTTVTRIVDDERAQLERGARVISHLPVQAL
jgi:hypothetical protein